MEGELDSCDWLSDAVSMSVSEVCECVKLVWHVHVKEREQWQM